MEFVYFFIAAVLILSVLIQYFLSKSSKKYYSYILPILNFMGSLLMQVNIYIHRVPDAPEPPSYYLYMFIAQNILTIILLAVGFITRKRMQKKSELDRMNIQDL